MEIAAPRPLLKVVAPLGIQVLIWAVLTVAFAALLVLASPQTWTSALRFSALIWMPWAVLGPAVFWFSGRFPLERGHLLRSIPAHLLACGGCIAVTLTVATYTSFAVTVPRAEAPPPPFERRSVDRANSQRPAPSATADAIRRAEAAPAFADRVERLPRPERREPFGRRGPIWWPFLGATLLRANFDAAVYLLVAIAAHALAFYRRAQERESHAIALAAGLNRAKLDALRLQLQPHFLFNTLNAIATLVHRDAVAADELINDLGELLRLSLQTGEHEVPLSRELELLDRYIAIEKTRLADRLQIVREIDPAATAALVPTFVLQPLVENAIRHGIEPRLAPGTITLRARRDGPRLHLAVRDDGVGLKGATQSTARHGIGIRNTEARLRALHGDTAQLELLSPEAGGLEVRITLPYTTEPRREAAAPAV